MPSGRHRVYLGRRSIARGPSGTSSIVYEAHVKGFTIRHPRDSREAIRGTIAGLSAPAAVEYLVKLGITAIELLPVHAFLNDRHLDRTRAYQLLGVQYPFVFRPRSALSSPLGS